MARTSSSSSAAAAAATTTTATTTTATRRRKSIARRYIVQQMAIIFLLLFVQRVQAFAPSSLSCRLLFSEKTRLDNSGIIYYGLASSSSSSEAEAEAETAELKWNNNDTDDPIIIAMTREEGKNEKLRAQLVKQLFNHRNDNDNGNGNDNHNNSIQIVELPCIAHAHGPDYEQLESKLRETAWDYVVVTSPEAARILISVWKPLQDADATAADSNESVMVPLPKIAVVGKATEDVLTNAGIAVDFCPSKATAKVLVQELPARTASTATASTATDDATTKILYPASLQAATTLQDGLEARGMQVTRLNTYDTVTAQWTPEQQALAQKTTIVCVASPSSLRGWLENGGPTNGILAACIGETSAEACRRRRRRSCNHNANNNNNNEEEEETMMTTMTTEVGAGLDESVIFYPDKPGIPGWVDAVQQALNAFRNKPQTTK